MTRVKIGIIGTGAIAEKHANAWRNIGCAVVACANQSEERGKAFASRWGAEFVSKGADLCRHPEVDLVDVCTFPDYRRQPVSLCAELGKPIQLQKPIATRLADAHWIAEIVSDSGITAGVVSQHRFDRSAQFVYRAIRAGRLGRIIQADCYVKWYRSPEYYARAIKGSWSGEGGGALINQAIHQVDLLRWMIGPVSEVYGRWQLGATHRIESEDVVNAIVSYENGATGVIQAATALWPGYAERIEIHGSQGSAIITGDRLTHWDVRDDSGEKPPLMTDAASGASDPMAISLEPFEKQFQNLIDAHRTRRSPLVSVIDGVNALAIVEAIYESCRTTRPVSLQSFGEETQLSQH